MKNLYNVGWVILILVVLGCNCQQLKDLADEARSPSSPTPMDANTSSSPAAQLTPRNANSTDSKNAADGLTMAKFEQLKEGMSYREVVALLGMEGEVRSSTRAGGSTIKMYEFKGRDNAYIYCNFTDDKMTFWTQANLR